MEFLNLRDYQKEMHNELIQKINSNKSSSVCNVLPTGGGKSLLITALIGDRLVRGKVVLFLSHRKELVNGIFNRCVNQLDTLPNRYNSQIFICNISSYKKLASKFNITPELIDTVIIDECHHVLSSTYVDCLLDYKIAGCNIIGYTATPKRLDNKPLTFIFDDIIQSKTLKELTDMGYLCPYKLYKSDESLEIFQGIKYNKKDYIQEDVLVKIKRFISHETVLKHYNSVPDAKAISFVPSVEYAEDICKFFNKNGVRSAVVTAKTKDRDEILKKFSTGFYRVLFNVELFTEGIDVPDCNMLLNLRLTKSIVLWHQIIGRILRTHKSKTVSHLFDFTSNWHDLPFPDNIVWELDEYKEKEKKFRMPPFLEITFNDTVIVNDIHIDLEQSNASLNAEIKREIEMWISISIKRHLPVSWIVSKFTNLYHFNLLKNDIEIYTTNRIKELV
jgi:superfamily II DNA or RNA helicase